MFLLVNILISFYTILSQLCMKARHYKKSLLVKVKKEPIDSLVKEEEEEEDEDEEEEEKEE